MLLKKITVCEDGTTDINYTHLDSNFTVTHPDMDGNFGKRTFGYNEEIPEPGVVAVLGWANQEGKPIFIFEDQAAYIIGDSGQTITTIHKLPPLIVWYRNKTMAEWEKLKTSARNIDWYHREKHNKNSDYIFKQCFPGEDPNIL